MFKGTGDFNGDGTSDILFENADTGEYAIWDIKNDAVTGGGNIGDPGPDWTFKAIGNYWGNQDSDILFQNVVTGQYMAWELDDTSLVLEGAIGAPGAAFSVVGDPPAVQQELPGEIFLQNSADDEILGWNVERRGQQQ